jgi:anti-sigma B factor antagonist
MRITERDAGAVKVVEVSGRLTLTENPGRIKERVHALVFDGQKHIVLNMAGVSYVDSSWLGELVACHLAAVRGGSIVKLAAVGPRLGNLLQLTRLNTVIETHETEAEALESFANAPV